VTRVVQAIKPYEKPQAPPFALLTPPPGAEQAPTRIHLGARRRERSDLGVPREQYRPTHGRTGGARSLSAGSKAPSWSDSYGNGTEEGNGNGKRHSQKGNSRTPWHPVHSPMNFPLPAH